MLIADCVDTILRGTTGSLVAQAWNRGWDEAAPVSEWTHGQRSERNDAVTCPLCRAANGRIVDRRRPDAARWSSAFHINCRGFLIPIHRDERDNLGNGPLADFPADGDLVVFDPDKDPVPFSELIEKHGHFVSNPERYAPLNVPARPTGRDFIAYRRAGEQHVTLRWRDNLPNPALRETLQDMAAGFGGRLGVLDIAGDVELAIQILHHASERELFRSLPAMHAEHAGDWIESAGMLSEDDFRSIPRRAIADAGTGLGTHASDAGDVEWFLHNPALPLDAERTLDDAVVIYRPEAADITDIFRLPPEVS